MSYIGKSPAVGNFVKLDAISTSSTNTYNLTVDSVAFVPESALHMLVSLNGIIQSPLSSFSVSGSTITFIPASGTLSSSDSIDFIMVYGNVLDIGTPSDATVTNAKTNFVSTSSNAGLQIKGDGTTDGTLQLNCSQNSHGIKLKSPPHSASASYTLTFPNDDGASGEALTTNGSGVLTWASAGGSNNIRWMASKTSDQTLAYNTKTTIEFSNQVIDVGACYNDSTYKFTVPSGEGGTYMIGAGGWVYDQQENAEKVDFFIIHTPSGGSANDSWFQSIDTGQSMDSQRIASHISGIQTLSAGDTLHCAIQVVTGDSGTSIFSGSGNSARFRNYFWGYKLIT